MEDINVRYLEDNRKNLYYEYKRSVPGRQDAKMGTFLRYLNKTGEFKNPFRLTDLCQYCEHRKKLISELKEPLRALNYLNWERSQFDPVLAKNFVSDYRKTATVQEKNNVIILKFVPI
jgi:hypothetical protein